MLQLIEKSLVALDTRSAESRLRLLETTRAYAMERLVRMDDSNDVSRRHASFYRDLLVTAAEQRKSTPHLQLPPKAFIIELDNIRAALKWAL